MKKLRVSPLPFLSSKSSLPEISSALDGMERHLIACCPWSDYSSHPHVTFSISYAADAILLKYFVQEKTIRISCHADNSPVHEDSCVEFFVAFGDRGYYNLEFNSIGHCYFSYGQERSGRRLIGTETIELIRHMSAIRHVAGDELVRWELVLMIPREVFIYDDVTIGAERSCKVNFFKCGDKLPEPHFLSWNPVEAEEPDFHLPQYFGEMEFI